MATLFAALGVGQSLRSEVPVPVAGLVAPRLLHVARTATSRAIRAHNIEWVPVLTHFLAGIVGRVGVAAKQVLLAGDGFKVRGVHATPVAAEMVKLETIWNRPRHEFVRDPMCEQVVLVVGIPENTVALAGEASLPLPAAIASSNLGPEPGLPILSRASIAHGFHCTTSGGR